MTQSSGLLLSKYPLWLQWVGAFGVMLKLFACGLSVGWASPYLASFTSGTAPFPATTDEVSWMASTYQLGRFPGAILGAVGVQYFGGKIVIIGNAVVLLISWILVIVSNSVPWIYAARFLSGLCVEAANICYPLYLGDISSPSIRGTLMVLAINGLSLGIVAGYAIGPYVSMRVFSGIGVALIIGCIVIVTLLPQSPYYLVSKNKTKEAENSVLSYNRKADVQLEMDLIRKFVARTESITFTDRLRELNLPKNRKYGLILIALIFFMQTSGMNVLITYTESIATRGMLSLISPSTMPITMGGLTILGAWTSMYYVDKFERKTVWVFSTAGLALNLIALGTHFYLLDVGVDPSYLQWLFILSVSIYGAFSSMGMGSIPYILLSELFGSNIRTLAICICCSVGGLSGFVGIYGYQYLLEVIAESYIYWITGAWVFVALIFGLVLVPNTKGKTLTEIQDVLLEN
ncbi:facilitated trehalose transporter Tret1-like [Neodiprion virginianus]|uniref:facilitated trehalose transporter Tret1-like n=1 Tax=Neodiprion virginianus TaxID=2961670 RepID=UPI001EE773F5|nr:facilitated trehalose transporter Tret1-like [Neodiprion virginianus]